MVILLVRYVTLQVASLIAPRWIFRKVYTPSLEVERDLEALGRNRAHLAAWHAKRLTFGKK